MYCLSLVLPHRLLKWGSACTLFMCACAPVCGVWIVTAGSKRWQVLGRIFLGCPDESTVTCQQLFTYVSACHFLSTAQMCSLDCCLHLPFVATVSQCFFELLSLSMPALAVSCILDVHVPSCRRVTKSVVTDMGGAPFLSTRQGPTQQSQQDTRPTAGPSHHMC
jgi:hypothetical protein